MEEAFKINQNQKSKKNRNDTAVQGTNDSAVLSKISMAQLGYFNDDFLKYFGVKAVRRSPIINRGYYIRAKTVDYVLQNFLKYYSNIKNQMINLGAGFDSTYFRLKNQFLNTLYIDIDFPDVITRKINLIKSNDSLFDLCSDLKLINTTNGNFIYKSEKSSYVLIGIDMRDTQLLEAMLKLIEEFNDSAPTIMLSEVVLTYMAVNSCNHVLKWIPETFQNCMIAVYEQVLPNDAFGQVMCAHFKKLGSPLKCIYKYPTKDDQIQRYKDLGFKNSKAFRIIDFFKKEIDNEEIQRINKIELFDEYEQWHLKCSHYTLVLSVTGNMIDLLNKLIYESSYFDIKYNSMINENLIEITEFPLKFGVRFGHSVCWNSSSNTLYIFGGFGESINEIGRHRRLNSIEIIDLNKMNIKICKNDHSDRLFGTSCFLTSNNSILLIYGRSSPNKVYELVELSESTEKLDENLVEFKVETYETSTNSPLARWRHGSCRFSNNKIFIFGGKRYNPDSNMIETLNDCYLFSKTDNNKWFKYLFDNNICKPRHSHSLCVWKDRYVFITGGLNDNEDIYDDILVLDIETNEIKQFTVDDGYVCPRYSHTSHIINDKLFLIGGVNFNSKQPGICIIDLNKPKAIEFDLPVTTSDGSPLMIHNHQTHVIDENNILVIGGGGNCFSFGTHINKKPIVINIKKLWSFF